MKYFEYSSIQNRKQSTGSYTNTLPPITLDAVGNGTELLYTSHKVEATTHNTHTALSISINEEAMITYWTRRDPAEPEWPGRGETKFQAQ
jgi:hypothetical protein